VDLTDVQWEILKPLLVPVPPRELFPRSRIGVEFERAPVYGYAAGNIRTVILGGLDF
jgi:hypothetical protein